MRTLFLICLILAVLFLVIASACSLAGFSQIGKDEEKEINEKQERKTNPEEKTSIDEHVTPADRIIFHEEEDGI